MKTTLAPIYALLLSVSSISADTVAALKSDTPFPDDAIEIMRPEADLIKSRLEIDDQTLYERYQTIKPLYREKETNVLYTVEDEADFQRLRDFSYIWDPQLVSEVSGLEKLFTIETYHPINVFFKPTIAEVLAQVPEKYVGDQLFFEVTPFPYGYHKYSYFSLHSASTTFYRMKN